MPTNDDLNRPLHHDPHAQIPDSPGYEVTDANVNGVAVFLAGLGGSLLVFLIFCFVLGAVINKAIETQDGPTNKWNQVSSFEGAAANGGKRKDLASAPEMEQKALQQMTSTFPAPRLDNDDGEQSTAELHSREDLLLEHYSVSPNEGGSIRIPITRAMELIAQRGLPVETAPAATEPPMVGDDKPVVQAPLTTGFARTGYEMDVIKAREEKMLYNNAVNEAHGESAPVK